MFFNKAYRQKRKTEKELAKAIQAMAGPEGLSDPVQIESLLSFIRLNSSIGGTTNSYKSYESQVAETYRKYNGEADWGCQQTRAVLDIRTAFIAGEGFTIACKDGRTADWITTFLEDNKFFGKRFQSAVLAGEITGKVLLILRPAVGVSPKIIKIPYHTEHKYEVVLQDSWDPDSIIDIVKNDNGKKVSIGLENFVYLKLGGDDKSINKTTTRVGAVLNELENYDRALKDIRRLNHIGARITPSWLAKDSNEVGTIKKTIEDTRWKIGDAWIGTAALDYKTPGTGAHDNLKTELASTIKTISSVTSVPVHWIGWADLLSNRSTAESLYETINNGTVAERTVWAESMYDLIVKAQELYIDSGGEKINTVNRDFEVKIPVIDYSNFINLVRALSVAYNDNVISRADYQNFIPGLNPLYTNKQLEAERIETEKQFIKTSLNLGGEENHDR